MRFLCRIGWHQWTNWKQVTLVAVKDTTRESIGQERVCKDCEFREISNLMC